VKDLDLNPFSLKISMAPVTNSRARTELPLTLDQVAKTRKFAPDGLKSHSFTFGTRETAELFDNLVPHSAGSPFEPKQPKVF
jgi:hypothetical protein